MPPLLAHQKFRYLPALDGIRGIAVIFVMMLHGSYNLFKGGWIGVDLFFVLSGYLITSLLQTEYAQYGSISFKNFYIRRALRLFPALIISVIIANLLWNMSAPYFYHQGNRQLASIAALLYFINLIPGEITGNMGQLWSLCVEEHFYIIWPASALLFFKLNQRQRIFFLALVIVAITVFRLAATKYNLHFSGNRLVLDPYRFTLCRIDNILWGCLLAFVLNPQCTNSATNASNKKNTWPLLVCAVLFGIILCRIDIVNKWWLNGGFIFTNMLCIATIYLAVKSPTHFLLSNSILQWIGVRAYGIYLYHRLFFYATEQFRVPHSIPNFIVVTIIRLAATLVAVYVSYKYVEQPLLRLKMKYKKN